MVRYGLGYSLSRTSNQGKKLHSTINSNVSEAKNNVAIVVKRVVEAFLVQNQRRRHLCRANV